MHDSFALSVISVTRQCLEGKAIIADDSILIPLFLLRPPATALLERRLLALTKQATAGSTDAAEPRPS